jgi:hypothetical protein
MHNDNKQQRHAKKLMRVTLASINMSHAHALELNTRKEVAVVATTCLHAKITWNNQNHVSPPQQQRT